MLKKIFLFLQKKKSPVLQFYCIEQQTYDYTFRYRFSSLFNSCKGSWVYSKKEAIEDGEKHRKLLLFLYNKGGN